MGLATILAMLMDGDGPLIVRTGIPAFIVTLGGLLVFRGLFWLTIRNSTVPVTQEGSRTCTRSWPLDLSRSAGLTWRPCSPARCWSDLASPAYPVRWWARFETAEAAFLKVFVAAEAVLLAVRVCNRYRGVPGRS